MAVIYRLVQQAITMKERRQQEVQLQRGSRDGMESIVEPS